MTAAKGRAQPVKRTPAQVKRAAAQELGAAKAEAEAEAQTKADAAATTVAQVANLLIAGHTFEAIGRSIGATPEEVERLVVTNASRYVRTQPSLRIWVRNYLSSKYTTLLDAVWDEATDKNHKEKLEHQDRALRILKEMKDLHGAAAPTQSEVKVESSPEEVDRIVQRLSAMQGQSYDTDIFDVEVVEGHEAEQTDQVSTAVHEGPAAALRALEQASRAVDDDESGDML